MLPITLRHCGISTLPFVYKRVKAFCMHFDLCLETSWRCKSLASDLDLQGLGGNWRCLRNGCHEYTPVGGVCIDGDGDTGFKLLIVRWIFIEDFLKFVRGFNCLDVAIVF